MVYMGSKNRIAKEILPIILKDRKPNQCYVETMVGGGNLIDKVEGFRIGADLNPFVIEALKLIRDNPESLPDHVSEEYYQELKIFKHLPLTGEYKKEALAGFVGFTHSFAGKWFRGFARDKKYTKEENERNVSRRAKNNALAQTQGLQGALLINQGYQYLDIPKNSIIYCDPPYEGTEPYKDGFNHAEFWGWVRTKSLEGHSVFVSEYNAPEDFICVWEKKIASNLSAQGSIEATEKLFIFNDLY